MTNQPLARLSGRLAAALAAGTAAIAMTAVLATAGSAQPSSKTLHLVATTQKGVGFVPSGQPRQGVRLGSGTKITGDDTGYGRTICTLIGRHQALCNIQLQLSRGALSAQAIVSTDGSHTTLAAITGGTRAYSGARGTAEITKVTPTTTHSTITLLS